MAEQESNVTQTELQQSLTDSGGGAFGKYQKVVLGRSPLILYELAMFVAQNTPGAAGLLLRKQLYSRLLGRCGRGVIFGKGVVLRHPDKLWIGDNVVIDDNVVLDAKGEDSDQPNIILGDGVFLGRNTILSCKGGTITLGDNANFGANCQIQSESKCVVGSNVLLASYCYLIAGGNHGIERIDIPPIQQKPTSRGGVTLCDGTWLGANVKVIDGVTMGRDTVAAAGATVVRNCEDFDIIGGVPAKKLKNRLELAKENGDKLPEDLTPNLITPPTRHDPVLPEPGAVQKTSFKKMAISSGVKVLFSAALIWMLVALQSKPSNMAFEGIKIGETTQTQLEAEPKPEEKKQAFIKVETTPEVADQAVYGIGVKEASQIRVTFDENGVVKEKKWERQFWASVWSQVKGFDKKWLLFVGLFHLLGYLITCFNWRQMFQVQGKRTKFLPLVGSNIIAGLFNNILPSNVGGDVIRIRDSAKAVFGTKDGNDYTRATTVIVMQRMIGLFSMLLITMIAMFTQAGALAGSALSSVGGKGKLYAFFVGAIAIICFCAILLRPSVLAKVAMLMDFFRGLPVIGNMAAKFLIVLETVAKFREQRVLLLRIFLASCALQINVIIYYYFCAKVLHFDIAGGLITAFSGVPLVLIMMMLVPSINGVGVRDWGFKMFLGMPASIAIAFSLIDVLWRFTWGILGGILLMLRGKVNTGDWLADKGSNDSNAEPTASSDASPPTAASA